MDNPQPRRVVYAEGGVYFTTAAEHHAPYIDYERRAARCKAIDLERRAETAERDQAIEAKQS